jgi:hypothetical protein
MATHRISLFDPMHDAAAKKPAASIRLPQTVRNDVFLSALLEMPTTKQVRRSPLEWAGAMALHIAILAALVIVPLYTTGTIGLNEFAATPLIAPPPAAPAPPAPGAVAPHFVHPQAKLTYKLQKVTPPTSVPKKVSSENVAESAPDLGGVIGGVPGGVIGGQLGGAVGGVVGGTGTSAPPPPPQPRFTPKVVHVGGNIKPPRQTLAVNPEYPTLARRNTCFGHRAGRSSHRRARKRGPGARRERASAAGLRCSESGAAVEVRANVSERSTHLR